MMFALRSNFVRNKLPSSDFNKQNTLMHSNEDSKTFKRDKFQAEIISSRKMSQGQAMKLFPPDSQICN